MNVQQICEEAHKLSVSEQGELITLLLKELGKPNYDVSDEEISIRVEETRSGSVEDISQDDLISGLKRLK
jgi:hypothetical protein